MPNVAIHPTPQELSGFALGKLSDSAATAVAHHLENCLECRQAIEKLPADSFIGKVRAARPGVSSLSIPTRSITDLSGTAAIRFPAPKDLPLDLARYNKYRFVRELGRGGMGVVYQAEQTVMGRTVAVKVINPSVLDHPDALPRFQSEVRAAAKLDHPNIVRAHDAEQVGSMHLLVMEYVEGTSLAELVMKKGPLSVPYACHYIRQAALGLQHAFEQGMVHRDIKPQNLMVNARGQVKVLDFGLARMRSARKAGVGLTQVDAFMGTPEYVSPEQATDARNADTRADIYSLGCTLFFLLTGRPPFQEESMVKLVLAQIEKEPPLLRDVRADVPAELSALVSRMLAKHPAARFQTPLEVAQALAVFVKAGAKPPAGVSALAPGVSSPTMGTAIAADTSQIKAVLRDAPSNSPAAEAQPFEGLREAVPVVPRASRKATKSASRAWYRRGPVRAALGATLLGLALGAWLLAGIVFKTRVKTPDGEAVVVLEIDQGDAEVTVDGHKINVQVPGDNKPVQIQVEPGRPHKLRVNKDGFEVFGRDVELQSGKSVSIRVRLEPVKAPAKRADQPVAPPSTFPLEEGFVSLFNGKDLSGWKTHPTQPGKWRVENSVLTGSGSAYGLLYSERDDYKDFHLRVEARINRGGDGGILFRSGFGPANPAKDLWQVNGGYEAQIYYNNPGDLSQTGSLFANDGSTLVSVLEWTGAPGEWVTQEVIAEGNHLVIKVNGKTTADYIDEQRRFTRGHIAMIKSDWNVATVLEFRKIEIKELPAKDAPPEPPKAAAKDGFAPLFNGKDLTGWKTHPAQPGDWHVKDGILVSSGRNLSHLYSERGDYKDFHLRVETRINPTGDSGVEFRTGFGSAFPAKNPVYPFSYEAQIYGGDIRPGFPRSTGSLYAVGFGPVVGLRKSPKRSYQWFTLEVIAEGNHLVVKVNGQTTADYTDEKRLYRSGHIALQQHNTHTVAEFRKIEIKELPAKAASTKPPKTTEPDDFVSLFNGKDLTGWKTHPSQPGDWRVANGILVGSGPATSYLYTERGVYENFHLRVEGRINPKGNSGIYFRRGFGPAQTRTFASGHEAAIFYTHPRDAGQTGSLCTGSGASLVSVRGWTGRPGEWFTMEVIAEGKHIVIKVNGKTTADYNVKKLFPAGHIALQQYTAQTVVEFRKIEIKQLPAK